MKCITLHDKTPVLQSAPLSKHTGQNILLKMDCYQPVGSFKIRGIGRLCQYHVDQGKRHLVASSGGNAGYAVAYAGRSLGVDVTVFLPSTSKQIFVDAIKSEGAEVKVVGNVWDDAHQAAMEFADKVDGGYVPPFDHPLIWSGHATIITELVEAGIRPDAIAVSIGGGGLACGLLEGMHQYGWQDVPLLAVEVEGAASFSASLKADHMVVLDKVNTIATSLATKRITQKLLDWYKVHPIIPIIVSDKSAAMACYRFADDHRAYVEPSCGAALSVVYDKRSELAAYKNILVIVCGGIGMSHALMREYVGEIESP